MKKGFTLIEVIISVLVISILAVIALNSYVNSTSTFSFLATYDTIISHLRNARSYAINNKQIQNEEISHYGVCITARSLIFFADNGDKNLLYEPSDIAVNACGQAPQRDFADPDTLIAKYTLDNKYTLSAYTSKLNMDPAHALTLPILMFYEKGNGNLTMLKTGAAGPEIIPKSQNKYVILRLTEGPQLSRYIVAFLVSGLVEEYPTLNSFQ